MAEPLLDKKEAAKYLRVSTRTIGNYRKQGLLTACKVGGKILFKESELFNALKPENIKGNGK